MIYSSASFNSSIHSFIFSFSLQSTSRPAGWIRRVFIVYNSLEGNGPPDFVKWTEAAAGSKWAKQIPNGCSDKAYVAGEGDSLVAIPHCLTFPADGDWPGKTRDASQVRYLYSTTYTLDAVAISILLS